MTVRIAHTTHADPKRAAEELKSSLDMAEPSCLLVFATPSHDPAGLTDALSAAFDGVPRLGCTTAGELVSGAMLDGSVVAMAIGDDVLEGASVAVVADAGDRDAIEAALSRLATAHGGNPTELSPEHHVGIVLHDGLAAQEEAVMDALGTLTNVPFVGASAGDGGAFEATHVLADGQVVRGGVALAILHTRRPYRILKTQSFDVTDTVLEVTDVDEATRTVRAFDGRPAAEVYAEAVGVTVEELADQFQAHPLGLVMPGGEPFVRSPQQIKGTDIVFYCQMKRGTKLHVLDGRDIVADTKRDLDRALGLMGACRGIVNFNCILRTIELGEKGQREAYGALFESTPTIGFSTYGESYIGHISQTATMLLLA